MAWLKLNLHCFSPTGRSDLGRELANPGCFMSLNFVNLKQIVCVQAMLGWGGCAWDAFWDPRRWSKSYCRARLEPRRARPPLPLQDIKQSHFKASQQITETPLWSPSPNLICTPPISGSSSLAGGRISSSWSLGCLWDLRQTLPSPSLLPSSC